MIYHYSQHSFTEEDVLKELDSLISLHPTENLEDFTDLNVTDDYAEEDLYWQVSSSISRNYDDFLQSDHVILYIDHTTAAVEGKYFLRTYREDSNDEIDEEYVFTIEDGRVEFEEESPREEAKINIETFKPLVQLIDLSEDYLDNIDKEDLSYNPKVPTFSVRYRLSEDDENIQRVVDHFPNYDFPKTDDVFLTIGRGALSSEDIEIQFGEERDIRLRSSVDLRVRTEEEDEIER